MTDAISNLFMLVSHKSTILRLCCRLHAWNDWLGNCKLSFSTIDIYCSFEYINLK